MKAELVSQEFVVFWGEEASTAASFPSITSAGRLSMRTPSMINTTVPAEPSGVGYQNPEVDRLIDEEQKTGDQKSASPCCKQVGRILMDDAALVPLYTSGGDLRCRAQRDLESPPGRKSPRVGYEDSLTPELGLTDKETFVDSKAGDFNAFQ